MNFLDPELLIIEDDLFSNQQQSDTQEYFTNKYFPWYMGTDYTVTDTSYHAFSKITENIVEQSQLFHTFVLGGKINSDITIPFSILSKVSEKLNMPADNATRIKANLTTKIHNSNKNAHQTPHVDDSKNHLVMLYYVNDSDGDTFLFNEILDKNSDIRDLKSITVKQRVSPRRGRVVIFNGQRLHAGMYPRENNYRVVINFNIIV